MKTKPTDLIKQFRAFVWENSYLYQEYRITPKDWKRFKKQIRDRRIKEKYAVFSGTL